MKCPNKIFIRSNRTIKRIVIIEANRFIHSERSITDSFSMNICNFELITSNYKAEGFHVRSE